MATQKQAALCWLPDLCESPIALLRLLLVAVLLSLLLVLLRSGLAGFGWGLLGRTALLVTWITLLAAAGLCLLRRRLGSMRVSAGAALALVWLLLVTSACLAIALWVLPPLQLAAPAAPLLQLLEANLIALLIGGIALRYFYITHQLRERDRAAAAATLAALQARIEPHFLFNSMNTIVTLIGSDPANAERAALDLSDLFRAALSESGEPSTVGSELELAEKYLAIEQLRLGDRLRWQFAVDAGLHGCQLPSLTLQPLVENAVLHGIHPLANGGTIALRASYDGARLVVEIDNPVAATGAVRPVGRGMALSNLRARLQSFFGDEVELRTSVADGIFSVVMAVPRREGSGS